MQKNVDLTIAHNPTNLSWYTFTFTKAFMTEMHVPTRNTCLSSEIRLRFMSTCSFFFSVQLQEILKEKWSIDDELVPPIDKHEDAQRGNDHQNNQTWTSKWMRKIPRPATSYSDSTTTEKNVSAESEYHDHRCPQVNAERHKRETKRQRILKTERGLHTLSCSMRSSCTRLIHYG